MICGSLASFGTLSEHYTSPVVFYWDHELKVGSHGYDNVEPALDKTLTNLGVGYLDLYLMHWPVAKGLDGNKIEYLDVRLPPSFLSPP